MKLVFNRYTDDMLTSLGDQTLVAIILNAVVRGVLFTTLMQLLSLASVGQVSTAPAIAVLALIFVFIILSIDVIEKYAAREILRKRRHETRS